MKTFTYLLMTFVFVVLGRNTVSAHRANPVITQISNHAVSCPEESNDEEFVTESAQGALLEVKLGELTKTNASAQAVKDFGTMMIADHSVGYDQLKALALQKNITIPAGLSKKGQHKYEKLAKKTGNEFDKEYMDYMVEDHNDDIDEFSEAAEETKDADIKAWIAKALPTLKHHLEMAKSAYAAVK